MQVVARPASAASSARCHRFAAWALSASCRAARRSRCFASACLAARLHSSLTWRSQLAQRSRSDDRAAACSASRWRRSRAALRRSSSTAARAAPSASTRPVWKSKCYGAFVLNRRVDLHAIDATPARWRGDAGSSPLDGASTAASSARHTG